MAQSKEFVTMEGYIGKVRVNSDGENRNVGSQRSAEPAALAQTWGSGSSQQGPII